MASFHWFAKLAGSAAIAAMVIPSYSIAQSSGGTGGGGASTKGGVTPLLNDSTRTNPATDSGFKSRYFGAPYRDNPRSLGRAASGQYGGSDRDCGRAQARTGRDRHAGNQRRERSRGR